LVHGDGRNDEKTDTLLPLYQVPVELILPTGIEYIQYVWFKFGWRDFTRPEYFSQSYIESFKTENYAAHTYARL